MIKINPNNKNTWLTYKHYLKNRVITKQRISEVCVSFQNDIISQLSLNTVILLQFKIWRSDDMLRSITPVNVFTISKENDFSSFFLEYWDLKHELYKGYKIKNIITSYKIIDASSKVTKQLTTKAIGSKLDKFLPLPFRVLLYLYYHRFHIFAKLN